jgi:murein endopeptidase
MNKESRITTFHFRSNNRVSFFVVNVILPCRKHDRDSMRSMSRDGCSNLSRWFEHEKKWKKKEKKKIANK